MLRYSFGPFELDPEARLLSRNGEPVPIAAKTFDTLIVLVQNRGRLVDKEELLSRVWAGSVVEEANLTQTIFTVRKILGDSPNDHRYIATVAGRGYQFVAPVIESTTNGADIRLETQHHQKRKPDRLGTRLLPVGAAVVVIATLAIGAMLWRTWTQGRDRSPQMLQLSRFTSYPGVETMPAFSPDGKEIAYVRAEHDPLQVQFWATDVGGANIYTKLVGAGTELRLTNHPGADYNPAWSLDGQYIAFYREEPGASGLYVVSAFGGQERRLTHEEAETAGIAWLPDGRHLLVSHFSEGAHASPLIEISLDTGSGSPITSPPAGSLGDAWPAISPDGKSLAFVRFKDTDLVDICLTVLSANRPHCWPLQGNWPEGVTWTPSGDGLVVSAIRNGVHGLWRYDLKGNPPASLTSGEEYTVLPTASRQRNQLAYVLSRTNIDLWELDVVQQRLSTPPVPGRSLRPVVCKGTPRFHRVDARLSTTQTEAAPRKSGLPTPIHILRQS
jgi:DNA-binding winged helix-turn-helix (wHTH) protein/dipeptidyl aminopeptidase/acylaminoacyl peptidase